MLYSRYECEPQGDIYEAKIYCPDLYCHPGLLRMWWKKQSSVQTDSGSEQPDATEESTEQSWNDPVTITFNSKTETYHADDLSTVLLYTSYQKPMVTIDGHPKISKTITQSLNEELDAFQDARLESLLSARISFAESPDSFPPIT